jgi:hypothetical protein
VVRKSVQDSCVEVLAQEHSQSSQDVVVRNILGVSSFTDVIIYLLENEVDHSYVKRPNEVYVVLQEVDLVPLFAMLQSIFK